jgi:methionine aminopeptidase
MRIRIETTVNMPEVPEEVEMGPGTLRDLLVRLFVGARLADHIIDPATGEIKMEGLFNVALNDVSYHSLREGVETPLQDGDVLTLSMILLGGG